MRRIFICPILAILAMGPLWMAPSPVAAQAETPPAVTMRLVSQTPWTGKDRPLRFSFIATNTSPTPLEELTVELLILAPARSRSLYELTLQADATAILFGYPFPETGALQPGESRTFSIEQRLEVLVARGESALYPLRVDLVSRDIPVGTLRSPMIFLIEHPEVPLNLGWSWILSEPIQYGPDGVFRTDTLEADIAPGGRIAGLVDALTASGSLPVDVVVSASLADQLTRMAAGYQIRSGAGPPRPVPQGTGGAADAARLLTALRQIATRPETELVGTPLGDPSLPALFQAGLIRDLRTLVNDGRSQVEGAVGRFPQTAVVRPIDSQLTPPVLSRLVSMGAAVVLLDTNFIPSVKFTTPATMRITSGRSSAVALLPEPEIPRLASAAMFDPRLAAQIALGELAAIWFEFPGTPGRGAAASFLSSEALPADYLLRFSTLVRRSPWLAPAAASHFATLSPPKQQHHLAPRDYPAFDAGYIQGLLDAKAALGDFTATIPSAQDLAGRLSQRLLVAESGAFVSSPADGRRFIESVQSTIHRTYSHIRISTGTVTLTSRAGTFPLTLRNDSGYEAHVTLRFVTDRRLLVVGGESRQITLPNETQSLTIKVRAQTTGRIPVKVQVLTSGDATPPQTIAEQDLIIRSTDYNRVALLITIGAALFLFAWWGRRFLPRLRS